MFFSLLSKIYFYLKIISLESKLVIVKIIYQHPFLKIEFSEIGLLILYIQMNIENLKPVLNIKNTW